MTTKTLLLATASLTLLGCAIQPGPGGPLAIRAQAIAQNSLLIDTHIDTPTRLINHVEDVSGRTPGGQFDYERARAGGLKVAFMVAFVPQADKSDEEAKKHAELLLNMVDNWVQAAPDKFTLVRSADEAAKLVEGSQVGLALGLENGSALGSDLSNVAYFAGRGIRYITLTHTRNNQIGDSSGEVVGKWSGLSPFGGQAVLEMQRQGVMIDVSHVADSTFYQVLELARVPVIASHSSCRELTPGYLRNMDDDMLRAIAKNGGVVQIAFGAQFLKNEYKALEDTRFVGYQKYLSDAGVKLFSPVAQDRLNVLQATMRAGTAMDVADHIDHAVKIAGIDHVGFGSDFDGILSTPTDVPDASAYPAVIAELLRRGYSEPDIKKILGENLMRVWRAVEAYSREH
ncbi:MAG: dipeptidase [Panacagrimonas sp.]